MLAGILAVLNMIPGISSIITTLTTAFFNSKVELASARLGADTAVATTLITGVVQADATRVKGLQVIGSSWVLSFLVVGFAVPWICYEWKIVIWDTMLEWGTTAPIRGAVADWATVIISCLFGSGSVITVGHMFFNRNKTGE